MSPPCLAVRFVLFGLLVVTFWYGLVPLALGTIEQLLGLHRPRRR